MFSVLRLLLVFLSYILYVISLIPFFALYFMYSIPYFVSNHIFYTLCLSPHLSLVKILFLFECNRSAYFFSLLLYILCITSLNLSLSLYLIYYISHLIFCLLGFYSCLSTINLLNFSPLYCKSL